MSDITDVIFSSAPEPEALAPEPEAVAQPEQIEEQSVPEQQTEPEAPAQPEAERSIPLPTFLDMRDARKAAERERDEWRQKAEAAQRQPTPQMPDPVDDPEGFARYQTEAAYQERTLIRFEMSEQMAVEKYGDDTVKAANEWAMARAQSSPGFAAEMHQQRHPIDWVVRQHKRDSTMSQIGDDPDEFVRRRAAELGLLTPANPTPPQQQAQPAAAPPRSLAAAPSSGGGVKDIPTGPMAALDAVFPR